MAFSCAGLSGAALELEATAWCPSFLSIISGAVRLLGDPSTRLTSTDELLEFAGVWDGPCCPCSCEFTRGVSSS
jgi:hypothetical protein